MIRSVCCVCEAVYRTKDDGRQSVVDSHGYCERHYDEAMLDVKSYFAELSATGAEGPHEAISKITKNPSAQRTRGAIRDGRNGC